MNKLLRREIMPGVFLSTIQTDKFKTGCFGLNILRPLSAQEASKNALLPRLLLRGSAKLPDMERMSAARDELYGARIEGAVRKKGEVQCIGFVCDVVDEHYLPGEKGLFTRAVSLAGDALLDPVLEAGAFKADYLAGEKDNLIDQIRAEVNDKITYARTRLVELMCRSEPFGIGRFGSEGDVAAIAPEELFAHYRAILATSRIELFYCGSLEMSRVEEAFLRALEPLERSGSITPVGTAAAVPVQEVREFCDHMDVGQGKLSIGLRSGVTARDGVYPAAMVMNTLFGASTTSKLFLNVREKLSLCYYASSQLDKHKGLMTVSSGVDFKDFDRAREEILLQFENCRKGAIEPWELDSARRTLVSALRLTGDMPSRLEDFYLGQAIESLDYAPDDLAAKIEGVTVEDAARAARAAQVDTIYTLRGLEGKEAGV